VTVRSRVYGFDGKVNGEKLYAVAQVPGSTTIKAGQIDVNTRISPIYFVKLDLMSGDGQILSSNVYWQNVAQDDFTGLMELPTAKLQIKATSHVEGENTVLDVHILNPTKTVALMAHLQLHQKESGARALPVFYSDNYITLMQGESRSLTIQAATKDLGKGTALILVDGFNVDVEAAEGAVSVAPNVNAQPSHWPASNIVPEQK
jgi:mannosylglycoprotein endo-beta-mannosidase